MSSQNIYSLKTVAQLQYRFGSFTLDLNAGFLRRDGSEVPLRPKAFELLTYLVERHGRLVSKAELIDALWPDAAVTENSLSQCLLEIRRALGDESQRMIRTVARRGYMFAAPVSLRTRPALPSGAGKSLCRARDRVVRHRVPARLSNTQRPSCSLPSCWSHRRSFGSHTRPMGFRTCN